MNDTDRDINSHTGPVSTPYDDEPIVLTDAQLYALGQFYYFRIEATMHDGAQRRATVCGLARGRELCETIYSAALRDATRQARKMFTGAAEIRVL